MSLSELLADVALLRGHRGGRLREMLRTGAPVDPVALAGFEYRGVSLLPWVARAASWTKFKKAFVADPAGIRGWNVRTVQTPLEDDTWMPMCRRDGVPKTFGHFMVRTVSTGPGALLDYGACARWYDPMGPMRDPLVCLTPGDITRLVGGTYLRVGPMRLWTPAFFYLQRDVEVGHVPALPAVR